jgi:hypothetical protein
MRRLSMFLFHCIIVCLPAAAQESGDTLAAQPSPVATITIETDQPGAKVFLDGDSVGTTPLRLTLTQGGKRQLRLVPRGATNWLIDPVNDTIDVDVLSGRGTEHTLRYAFSSKVLLVSTPAEAEVWRGDSLIGTTPLVVQRSYTPLLLRKMGYADTTLDISQVPAGILKASLQKVWKSTPDESIFKDAEESRSSLRLYITGATTVIAGATSAYFKVKADNLYSQYVRTRDPSQLAEVNRLDTAAGIALAATQLSLGLFAYFMLSE